MKDLFAQIALSQIPKILTLMDRNKHSPTYGCFDRNYWHYKIIDFPSGMAQEFLLPLALVYNLNIPKNPYYKKKTVKELIKAGIHFAAKSSHKDGSCDDYYRFERAGGATAFSLLACIYSYDLIDLKDNQLRAFFKLRVDWLASNNESGQLSNHQALIVLCLTLASKILKTKEWDNAINRRLEILLEWQDEEGWFQEYEGCDLGYQTLTISTLAWIYELKPLPEICKALKKAVIFASHFVHPDGSFGGEYSSRNTYSFFPHGFELIAKWFPEATNVNDRFILGFKNKLHANFDDDHIVGHHTWNYLLAWRDYKEERPQNKWQLKEGRTWFPNAKLLIERQGESILYIALNKGGVFKLFRKEKLVVSDTQFSVKLKNGHNAVGHMIGNYDFSFFEKGLVIKGKLGWSKHKIMTTFNLILLRTIMLSIGYFYPNLIRVLLQRYLITGKKPTPFIFKRKIEWEGEKLKIEDSLFTDRWDDVEDVCIGPDQTSIYVAMSRTYQTGQLQDWITLNFKEVKKNPGDLLVLKRIL
jgi:hypothetical protein